MRRTLGALIGGLAVVAAMALPAGAAPVHRSAEQDHHSTERHHEGGSGWRGEHGDRRVEHGDRRDDRDWREWRRRGDDHHDWRYYYGPGHRYGYRYYGPAYPPGACPDGGYYDADGTYWYWDPAADDYVACS
jgi:hypothetical protein